MEIVNWVEEKIEEGVFAPNAKIPSEYELMEQFKVSRQTVRKALEVLEEAGEVKSRQGSGTFVTEKQVIQNNCTRVAVITTYIDNYIFPKIIKGIEKLLNKNGYQVQISFTNNSGSREAEILRDLLSQELGGVIVETTKSALPNPNLYLYQQIQEKNIPIVFVHSCYPEIEAPMVSLEDEEAGRTMVRHLVEYGHKKIGGIFKMDDGQGLRRYSGYLKEMLAQGLQVKGNRIVWLDTEDTKKLSIIEAKLVERLKDCTAVVCYNDQVACGLIEIFRRYNILVPQDISITSVDNTELAKLSNISLTSVQHPKEELGIKAAEMLIKMMKTGIVSESHEFVGELFVRGTTKHIN